MTIPEIIVLLRDFTAWAILVFLVVGGIRGDWVWGWQYRDERERNKRLDAKLDEQSKVITDAVAVLGKSVEAVGNTSRAYEVVDTLKDALERLEKLERDGKAARSRAKGGGDAE